MCPHRRKSLMKDGSMPVLQDGGDIFRKLSVALQHGSCRMCTVTDGEHAGEKLLLSGSQVVGQTPGVEFLSRHLHFVQDIQGTQQTELLGEMIFCEEIGGPKVLVICGAGRVAVSLAHLAKHAGFRVVVLDDRPDYAGRAKAAGADEVWCDDYVRSLRRIPGTHNTYFVIVTKEHRYDVLCLYEILKKPNTYIGMRSSRRQISAIRQQFTQAGMAEGALDAVYAPIGMPIGAESPEEIAVSILAQLIQVRKTKQRVAGYDAELLSWLTESCGTGVLATVTLCKNPSASRIGMKMLILGDGRTVGTIGGGSVEQEVMKNGRQMLKLAQGGQEHARRQQYIVANTDALDTGPVHNGMAGIYLEIV